MSRRLFIFSILFIFPMTAAAQTLDQDKLRKAAYWPQLGIGFDINAFHVDEDGKHDTPARTIAKLTKRLLVNKEDAPTYFDLAWAYKKAGQVEQGHQTLDKVEAILRPHLQTKDPKDGHFLASYARYVAERFPNTRDVAEKWARRAVQVAPEDWRCWQSLAWRVSEPAWALLAKDAVDAQDLNAFTTKANKLCFEKDTMKLPWHEIKRRLDEGHDCIQKARAIAIGNDEMLDGYLHFREWEHPCRILMGRLRGQVTSPVDVRALPEYMQIQEELAQRQPTNLRHQARAAVVVLMTSLPPAGFVQLPPTSRDRYREYARRLEVAAEKADPETAAFLHEMLAMLHLFVNEKADFERHARRALQLDPGFENMTIALESFLEQDHRITEAIEVARANLKAKATPLACYYAANVYDRAKKVEEAEKALRRGLELDANHPHCQFGLAMLLLRRSDQPGALEEAGRLLAKVNPLLLKLQPPVPEPTLEYFKSDLEAHRAIYRALCGDNVEELKKVVRESLRKQPTRGELHTVAAAFGIEVSKATINREMLRASARFGIQVPVIGAQIGTRHAFRGAPINFAKQIEKLQHDLRDCPEDALVLTEIARMHAALGQIDGVKASCVSANARFARLLAKDASRSDWRTEYAWALLGSGEVHSADQLAMRIAEANPEDWRTWRNLGEYALLRSGQMLGIPYGVFQFDEVAKHINGRAVLDVKFARDVTIAEQWIAFGESSLAKAVQLAPQEPDAWLAQVHSHHMNSVLRNLLCLARGEPVDATPLEVIAQRYATGLRRLWADENNLLFSSSFCCAFGESEFAFAEERGS